MIQSPKVRRQIATQLDAALQAVPFVPFCIRVAGGASFEVRRPELVTCLATQILLARGNPTLGTERLVIETANVTSIEAV